MKRLTANQNQLINELWSDIDWNSELTCCFAFCCGVLEVSAENFYEFFRDFVPEVQSLMVKNFAKKVVDDTNTQNIFVFTVARTESSLSCIEFFTKHATSTIDLGINKSSGNRITMCVWDMAKIASRK